jgi:hypothetical protein
MMDSYYGRILNLNFVIDAQSQTPMIAEDIARYFYNKLQTEFLYTKYNFDIISNCSRHFWTKLLHYQANAHGILFDNFDNLVLDCFSLESSDFGELKISFDHSGLDRLDKILGTHICIRCSHMIPGIGHAKSECDLYLTESIMKE